MAAIAEVDSGREMSDQDIQLRQYAGEQAIRIIDGGEKEMEKAMRHAEYQADEISRLRGVANEAEATGDTATQIAYNSLADFGQTHLDVMDMAIGMAGQVRVYKSPGDSIPIEIASSGFQHL